ncbi:hypothetical protein [Demequina salsinemoris]|uniref:hypothetical protein n=1 Tax=Demequina salsinemoris TaxID=577470 RepID=UPI00128B32F1|nr:hypothetical protein [Demequina salsinemoris]
MFRLRPKHEPVWDPAVAEVEALLDAAARRHPAGEWEGRARHALSICACITPDHAPSWLIVDTDDGLGWERLPDGFPDEALVRAPLEAGGHADPSDVLAWLRGDALDPWATGDGDGDPEVVEALRRWVDAD